jgi:hypothetical protein
MENLQPQKSLGQQIIEQLEEMIAAQKAEGESECLN